MLLSSSSWCRVEVTKFKYERNRVRKTGKGRGRRGWWGHGERSIFSFLHLHIHLTLFQMGRKCLIDHSTSINLENWFKHPWYCQLNMKRNEAHTAQKETQQKMNWILWVYPLILILVSVFFPVPSFLFVSFRLFAKEKYYHR